MQISWYIFFNPAKYRCESWPVLNMMFCKHLVCSQTGLRVTVSKCKQCRCSVSWYNASHTLYFSSWKCFKASDKTAAVIHFSQLIMCSAGRPSRLINSIFLRCKAAAEPPSLPADSKNKTAPHFIFLFSWKLFSLLCRNRRTFIPFLFLGSLAIDKMI